MSTIKDVSSKKKPVILADGTKEVSNKKKLKKRIKSKNTKFSNSRYYDLQDKLFKYFAMSCTLLGILILVILLGKIGYDGFTRIDWEFLTNGPSRRAAESGIKTALMGSIWMLFLTAIITFPIGIGAAIYLEEYNKKGRFANLLEINISNLAGVPSIIYGLLGLEIFARGLNLGGSLLTGALTLSLLILPIIIVSTREAIRSVPSFIRDASYALGATKWQTIWLQVLPASISGIFTGVILALSRAVGETAPLILIGALTFVQFVPTSVMDEFSVLPIQIFNWVSRPQKAFGENAAAAIIVLLVITFMMNAVAIYLRNRWQKKIKW